MCPSATFVLLSAILPRWSGPRHWIGSERNPRSGGRHAEVDRGFASGPGLWDEFNYLISKELQSGKRPSHPSVAVTREDLMTKRCLTSLEHFNTELTFEAYNMHNSWRLGRLTVVEAELAVCMPLFAQLADDAWQQARTLIDLDLAAKLAAFSMRMAAAAVDSGDCSLLKSGIIAIALDKDVLDPRDVYTMLTILHDAATRLSAPFEEMCRCVAPFATTQRAQIILDGFLSGPEYMRSLRSMGVEFVQTDNTAFYRMQRF